MTSIYQLLAAHQVALGIGLLWVFSAFVSALPAATAKSGPVYTTVYHFLSIISGDLTVLFGKYMPPAAASSGTAGMVALLCFSLVFTPVLGCTQQQKIDVAQEIVNWTPALTSAVDTAGGLIEVLDPPSALIVTPSLAVINALSPQVVTAAKNYLANPSQTTIQVLQALIVQLQNNVNAALLDAVKISNPNSQQKATTAINGIATIVNSLLALVQGISSKAQVAAMSRSVTVHLAEIQPLLDRRDLQRAAARISADLQLARPATVDRYFAYEAQAGF
jgi:hypothetical protein